LRPNPTGGIAPRPRYRLALPSSHDLGYTQYILVSPLIHTVEVNNTKGTEIRREERNCKVAKGRVGPLRKDGQDHRLLACEEDIFTKLIL